MEKTEIGIRKEVMARKAAGRLRRKTGRGESIDRLWKEVMARKAAGRLRQEKTESLQREVRFAQSIVKSPERPQRVCQRSRRQKGRMK